MIVTLEIYFLLLRFKAVCSMFCLVGSVTPFKLHCKNAPETDEEPGSSLLVVLPTERPLVIL